MTKEEWKKMTVTERVKAVSTAEIPSILQEPVRVKMVDKLDSMIMEARAKNVFVRAFDVRYATAGHPELGEDYLYFPPDSFEVLETGNLQGPSQSTQKLTYGKLLPLNAILLVELCDPNK